MQGQLYLWGPGMVSIRMNLYKFTKVQIYTNPKKLWVGFISLFKCFNISKGTCKMREISLKAAEAVLSTFHGATVQDNNQQINDLITEWGDHGFAAKPRQTNIMHLSSKTVGGYKARWTQGNNSFNIILPFMEYLRFDMSNITMDYHKWVQVLKVEAKCCEVTGSVLAMKKPVSSFYTHIATIAEALRHARPAAEQLYVSAVTVGTAEQKTCRAEKQQSHNPSHLCGKTFLCIQGIQLFSSASDKTFLSIFGLRPLLFNCMSVD